MDAYYKHEGISIYHGDCREVVGQLPKDSVDLVVTDPPYGVKWQSGRRTTKLKRMAGDDGSLDVTAALTTVCRATLKRGRHLYVFGPFEWGDADPFAGKAQIIWDKNVMQSGDLSSPWGTSHESIVFVVYEISKANRKKGYGRLAARLRRGTVVRCQRIHAAATGRHPSEKPVRLLRELIEASSCMGETVCDPFMGSGSTLIAAVREERKAVGIEIDESYCEVAAKRLEEEFSMQNHEPKALPLFTKSEDSRLKSQKQLSEATGVTGK